MRPRTALAVGVLILVLVGVGAYAVAENRAGGGTLTEMWITDTERDTIGNHHVPAAERIGGELSVIIPVNADEGTGCTLIAVDDQGNSQWQDGMPAEACNIHGYGDPIVADFDRDGTKEVFVATTEEAVIGLDGRNGTEEFRHGLSWWGYAAPMVTDFAPESGPELVVADLSGGIHVLRPNETLVWSANLSGVVARPAVDDFDADGTLELAVAEGQNVTLLNQTGGIERRTDAEGGRVNWMTSGQADGDDALELVVGTNDGRVVAVDGRTGTVEWTNQFGRLSAVGAFGDGDGQAEVYATAEDGMIRAISANNGTIEWTTTLTTADVQMMPPPVLGDLDGDKEPELVAATQDGVVSVVDPASGDVLASYERDVPMFTHPALADVDGNGDQEILAVYGDGRVVALSFDTP